MTKTTSLLLALPLLALVSCKAGAPAPTAADAGVVAAAVDAGPQTPRPPEAPECVKHGKVLSAAMASIDPNPDKGPPPHLRGAFLHFSDVHRRPCPVEVEWQAVVDAVKALDDAHVLYDHTASEGVKVRVHDAAVPMLEAMTGVSKGIYEVPNVKTPKADQEAAAKRNATVRVAWQAWWTTAKDQRDAVLAAGKAKAQEESAMLEQQKLAKLLVAKIAVIHRWDVIPWAGPQLTPQDVVKRPGFKPEMLQTPVAPALIEEVKWGWYLKRDGALYRVLRKELPNKDWTLDAFKQETATAYDPQKVLVWPLVDKMPLSGAQNGQELPVTPAFVEWLRADPTMYYSVLNTLSFGATIVEGDKVFLLALRGGVVEN